MRAFRRKLLGPFALTAILALLLGACGSSPATKQLGSSGSSTGSSTGGGTTRRNSSPHFTPSTSGGTVTTTGGTQTATSGGAKTSSGGVATPTGTASPIPISGTITPQCVRPGGSATIVVQTQSHSAVAYDTYYSNGKTGGSPPFGDGYGGNAAGESNDQGRYTSTWVISPQAPAGAAYARVVVGHGGSIDETRVRFAVSNAIGDC